MNTSLLTHKLRLNLFILAAMIFGLAPNAMLAQSAYHGYTATAGTAGNSSTEGYASLVDNINSSKWCVVQSGSWTSTAYIEFYSTDCIIPSQYVMRTANDNADYTGRNPKSWVIKAKANSGDSWTTLANVSNNTTMQDVNNTSYTFDFPNTITTAYKYFRFEISAIQATNHGVMQLSEFYFIATTGECASGGGGDTPSGDELTVADQDGTNSMIPFYGLYANDNYQHTQTIYPSSLLTDMVGGQITKLTYYAGSSVTQSYGSTFQVRIGTTTNSSFNSGSGSYLGSDSYTLVYSNTLSVSGTEVVFDFSSTPYTYNGGNLVVDVRITALGSNYNGISFKGESGSINYSMQAKSTSGVPTTGTAVTFMPKTTFTYTAPAPTAPTCSPSFSGSTDYITSFSLGSISNTSSGLSSGGYGDFTSMSTSLEQGTTATASLTSSSGSGTHAAAVWIDFNDDGTFDSNTERVGTQGSIGASATVNISLTIPGSATTGRHRMRVVYQFNTAATNINPCASATHGEGEDYTVNITASPYPFTIASVDDWNAFCDAVNNGHDYLNETVTMTADVTTAITTMAGTESHPFKGTFNGQGHTLTVGITGNSTQGQAPFQYINGATIKNLVVTGSVTATSGSFPHAAGLVGFAWAGTNTIENCAVHTYVTNSGTSVNSHIGGIVGHGKSSTVVLKGCVYDGRLSSSNYKGGLVGWADDATIQLTDCLFNGTVSATSYFHPIGCCNDGSSIKSTSFVTNCYYYATNSINGQMGDSDTHSIVAVPTNKGKRAYSITGGTDVTVANAGTATNYNYSGITGYVTGIKYNNVLYAGSSETVSLSLGYSGSGALSGYQASNGTLTGSSASGTNDAYTISSITANSVITATFAVPATVPYTHDFENTTENSNWLFANGSYTNQWIIGTNTSTSSSHSLYISNNGSDNSYTNNSASYVYAYRHLNFTSAGNYVVSFKWKANGENGCWDAMFAALVPQGTACPPSSNIASNDDLLPSDYINASNASAAFLWKKGDWQTSTKTVNIPSAGVYTLVFYWKNDGSGGDNPPAAVDDIDIHADTPSITEIYTVANWEAFCDAVNGGHDYSGETVKLMNDITTAVTTMAGTITGETVGNAFKGTFDGQGHTLTLNISGGASSGWSFTAPFRCIDGATIKNLKTTGTVTQTGGKGAAGLVGCSTGTCTITNCVSNVTINSQTVGDGTHGGFISYIKSNSVTFNGCAFTGSITGSNTYYCGGFVGWNASTANFNNCVFAPTDLTFDYTTGNSANFSRNDGTFNNCYYTRTCGTGWTQGKLMHSITGASGITVANAGTATSYTPETSTIVGYGTGIKFNNILYAANNENVSLNLGGSATGSYKADHGTLTQSGDNWTLAMADANTVISTQTCPSPTSLTTTNVTANGATLSWNGLQESYNVRYREFVSESLELTYDFEDNTLQDWTTYDEDGDGHSWSVSSSDGHESSKCVHAIYNSSAVPNNWLISPQIPLGGVLSFYAKGSYSGTGEKFQIYVSTTGTDISNFTAISEVVTAPSSYTLYEYDLSGYSGEGYVAIKHTAAVNQYWLYVDDITYIKEGEYGSWNTSNTNVSSPLNISGLTPETNYQWQVQGLDCDGETDTDWSESATFTTEPCSTWTNIVNEEPSTWSIEEGVVQISCANDLAWFISYVNGYNSVTGGAHPNANAKLTADIDMNAHVWVPITGFAGTFDGGCHSISNLHINASEAEAAGSPANTGLFGSTVSGSTVKNLRVVDADFYASSGNLGGIVGSNAGTVQNCYSDATLSGTATNKGGIAGANTGTLSHSYTMVTSGVCGNNTGDIDYCYNKAANDETPGTGFTAPNYTYGKYHKNNTATVGGVTKPLVEWLNTENSTGQWMLPKGATRINGGYPVLMPASGGSKTGEALAVASKNGSKSLSYGTATALIAKYNTGGTDAATSEAPADIYVYGSGDLGNTAPNNANLHLFIDENVAVTQNSNAASSATTFTATVGITIDNSKGAVVTGQLLGRDWHCFATPLKEVPLGISYSAASGVNADSETVHNNMSFTGGYFPSSLSLVKTEFDFYAFSEPHYHWLNLKRSKNSHFYSDTHSQIELPEAYDQDHVVPGRGYLLAIGDNSEAKKTVYLSATGTLQNGDTTAIVTNSGAHLTGYNFLGNPYQSYLDFRLFANDEANIAALWGEETGMGYKSFLIYDADKGGFVEYLVDGNNVSFSQGAIASDNPYIHPHQGFFVAKSPSVADSTTVTFTNAMRRTDVSTTYRDEAPAYPLVNLICTDDNGKREVSIIEVERPSMAGALKMKDMLNGKGNMYIRWNDEDFSSMFLTSTPEFVPVWFKSSEEGVFTMSWSTANDNFGYLHLVDNLTGNDIDMLAAESYVFQSKPSDSKARFRLVFKPLGIEEETTSEQGENFAFISGNELVVNGEGELSLIDLNGRVLATEYVSGQQSHITMPKVAVGMYMLRLANANGVKVQKIVVRK